MNLWVTHGTGTSALPQPEHHTNPHTASMNTNNDLTKPVQQSPKPSLNTQKPPPAD